MPKIADNCSRGCFIIILRENRRKRGIYMSNLTISLTGSEVKAEFYGTNAWLRNDGTSTVYAGKTAGVTAGADGVVSIPAGGSAPVFDAHGTVYLIGTGSVLLIGSDYSENPFKSSAQGGSGADEVARAAIEAHAGNTSVHLTAEQLNSAVNVKIDKIKTVSVMITTTGWLSDDDSKYPFYYDIPVPEATAYDRADVRIMPDSIEAALTAGFDKKTDTREGYIRIRAKQAPTAVISAEYQIFGGAV